MNCRILAWFPCVMPLCLGLGCRGGEAVPQGLRAASLCESTALPQLDKTPGLEQVWQQGRARTCSGQESPLTAVCRAPGAGGWAGEAGAVLAGRREAVETVGGQVWEVAGGRMMGPLNGWNVGVAQGLWCTPGNGAISALGCMEGELGGAPKGNLSASPASPGPPGPQPQRCGLGPPRWSCTGWLSG